MKRMVKVDILVHWLPEEDCGSWRMSCKKYFCILTFLSPAALALLSLAGDRFDVPLCCRVMSAGLLGTPAELRTILPQEGKGWDLSLLWVHPCSIVCVHVYTCATLETDTRHGFQLIVKEAACFLCFLNSLAILVPHFSSNTFNVSNQRVWTREWRPSFLWGLHPSLYPPWSEMY